MNRKSEADFHLNFSCFAARDPQMIEGSEKKHTSSMVNFEDLRAIFFEIKSDYLTRRTQSEA